jgi:2,4-dienoyl-CoA reductase-like NADH-dependent reductase (Old Yellow Enzyme family)
MRAAEPFRLADLDLRNRLVGTAHGRGILEDGGTVVAPESTWRRRITTEAWRPEAAEGMAARAEAIRAEGAVAACQLVHLGRETTWAEQWFHPWPCRPCGRRASPRGPAR